MARKTDSVVFQDADAIKKFLLGQNKRVEAWFAENWERLDDMTGPIHKSTVSKALSGMLVAEPVANALGVMLDEIRADPWAWCEPPESIDDLASYAPMNWWFKTLGLKDGLASKRFERMNNLPLKDEDAEFVQERLSEWRERLRRVCDQFKADEALVRALESDEDPEYQWWVRDGDEIRLGRGDGAFRRRVGNPGLHGRSDDEIGEAWALADATLTLPDVERAELTYSRPKGVPVADHYSESVEPWNGQEFAGAEITEVELPPEYEGATPQKQQVKHRVCFYWHGDRYHVEDVKPYSEIWDDGWRVPTQDERDLLETGMQVSSMTKAQFEAQRDEWIDEVWEDRKSNPSFSDMREYPDGLPRSAIEDQFKVVLDRIDDEKARDEQREIARRRNAFRRGLRRREPERG